MSTQTERYAQARHQLGGDAIVLEKGEEAGKVFDPVAAWLAIVDGVIPSPEPRHDTTHEPEPRRTSAEWAIKSVVDPSVELARVS